MSTKEHEHRAHPVLHIAAPFVVLGTTWAARQILKKGYKSVTGNAAPDPEDPSVSFGKALAWALLIAGAATVIEMVIYRAASRVSPAQAERS
ncbi:MAG: DUF4235 domain-containing protein [Actinobacteria bacterium]|nr:DUF4235 domain-containing protein [Actinomycetota bacterium]